MVKQADKCNNVRGVGDKDRNLLSKILNIAAITAAGYNAYKALDIATQEWQMAQKYWRLARNWLDYYQNFYAPVEDQELKEARELEPPEPEYVMARGRARATAWIDFKGKIRDAVRCTSRYCTGLRGDIIMRLTEAQAEAVSLADGLGYRNERAYIETRDDVRWQRRLETAKRGRDIVAEVPNLAAASVGIYGSLLDQAWQGLQDAGMYLGYSNTRNDPSYPTTILSGNTRAVTGSTVVQKFNTPGVQSGVQQIADDIVSRGI